MAIRALKLLSRGALAGIVLMVALAPASASASSKPEWRIVSVAEPTNLPPSGEGQITVKAINVGGADTDGSPVTITDSPGPGLTATGIRAGEYYGAESYNEERMSCSHPPVLSCTYPGVAPAGDVIEARITVRVGAVGSAVNQASVSGGGAEGVASVSNTMKVSSTRAPFGIAPGSVIAAASSQQAGAHSNVTTSFSLTTARPSHPTADLRDVRFDLPPGAVGNTVGMPRCKPSHIQTFECAGGPGPESSRDAMVGVAVITTSGSTDPNLENQLNIPIARVFNIPPAPGEPAAFEFFVKNSVPVRLDTSVLSDGNYAVRVTAPQLSEAQPVLSATVTIWGVPADHQGPGRIDEEGGSTLPFGGPLSGGTRVPLLSNPTQCASPLTASVSVDSWVAPGAFSGASASMGTMSGCSFLGFAGSFSMLPDTLEAGAPAGYSLNLKVPQGNDPEALSQPYVKKVVTTLPMGTVISPSAAWGLGACSNAQFFGSGPREQMPAAPGACPRESQVGTVQIETPALPLPLTGQVYLAEPLCQPCSPQDAQSGRMVRLFLQVVGEGDNGIVVKLEGTAQVNQQTGQITATFDNNPQLPFSALKLTLGGGSRATLANPRTCGAVSTSMDLEPWSTPFTSDIFPSSAFEINRNCFGPQFNPSFTAGTTSIQAGQFSPFTVAFGRQDPDQFLNGLQIRMPPGVVGSLAGVPLCGEPQAALGTCGQESLIGHSQVLTGPGATPFLVTGGQVFLTGGYKGAPYGLSIVVPAKAGPYTLSGTTGQGTVVVRAAINVDPHTAALTVTSDPLPTALDGIPLQLREVNVTVDRPNFTLNPTSCNRMSITGDLSSKESAGVSVSSPFQVTNCSALAFKPQMKVSTSGKTSKANGASLDTKLTYPAGSLGSEANIAYVKVELPKALPSRLTTLQQACLAATFNANPARCPSGSVIGVARVSTPVLPVPLTGPVYFVSNGGEAFPNLVVILQGYGVRVDLVGNTFISKAGVTSTTFKTAPDVPFNSFELYLPQGKYSALAANVNLCKTSLTMPTTLRAQNGAELHQSTKITVTGCPKAKKPRKTKKAKKAVRGRRADHHGTSGRARS